MAVNPKVKQKLFSNINSVAFLHCHSITRACRFFDAFCHKQIAHSYPPMNTLALSVPVLRHESSIVSSHHFKADLGLASCMVAVCSGMNVGLVLSIIVSQVLANKRP